MTASDGGWGVWFRGMFKQYFWVFVIAVLVYLGFVSEEWVVQMVEKLVDKIGEIR